MKFKFAPAEDFTAINAAVPPARTRGGTGGAGPDAAERRGTSRRAAARARAEEHIDLTETVDADTGDVAVSSVGLLEQQLGATVVEEKSRD